MTDILYELRASFGWFGRDLRNRAAEKIKQLRDELDESRDDVVGLSETLKKRDALIDKLQKDCAHYRDVIGEHDRTIDAICRRHRTIADILAVDLINFQEGEG